MRHTLQEIITHYNNLLNERRTLSEINIIYPYRRFGTYRGENYHRRRINQLKRQVQRNIKRIENVIEKLLINE